MSNWISYADGAILAFLDALGQPITYANGGDAPVSANAILGQTAQREDATPGRYMRIYVRLADYPHGFVRGAAVTFSTSSSPYIVFEVEVDNNGGAYATVRSTDGA